MRRCFPFAVLLFCCLGASCGQSPPVQKAPGPAVVDVHLGNSALSLHGPWKFQVGDDPRWAQPGFDDGAWESVELGSATEADTDSSSSDLAPGWTAQGHPDHSGYAWYRMRVDVRDARTGLALKMPDYVDDAYQVFVNGQQIGQYGDFSHRGVRAYAAMPQGFRLPQNLRDGPVTIAIRVWMDSATRFLSPDAGGLRAPPVLGLNSTIAGQVRLDWDDQAHLIGFTFLETLVLLLTLAVTLTHFNLMRHDKAYLWLGAVVLVTLLGNSILQIVNFTTWIPQTPASLLHDVVLTPLRIALWVLFWASWFGLGTPRRLLWLVGGLALLLAFGTAMLRPPLHGQIVSLHAGRVIAPALLWIKLAMAAALLAVVARAFRRDRTEGWIALPAILLALVANYQHELHLIHVPITFSVARFDISLGEISTMLSLLIVTMLASRRFLLAQRQKVQWALEVQQARELQQLIIPRALPQVDGLYIESDYRPSREVGGDFFQVIPNRKDGSVLVMVGDVTGKGLRAGMLVALIVGALDAAAKEHSDPEYLLTALNDRLCERGFATATCLVMKITADGFASIANAGHLPPYLNGRELEMEGALPLGTLPGLDYTMTDVQLRDGDRLVLLTDGVVEATDGDGELLGFDRIGAMIAGQASVHEVADAAARHGQEDDILVLSVVRTAAATVITPAAA